MPSSRCGKFNYIYFQKNGKNIKILPPKKFTFFSFHFLKRNHRVVKFHHKKKHYWREGCWVWKEEKSGKSQPNYNCSTHKTKRYYLHLLSFYHIMFQLMVVEEGEHYCQLLLKRGKTCVKPNDE